MDLMALRRGLLEMITHTSGGDPIPAGCEIGTFTVSEDATTATVSHSLGEIPKFAECFCIPNKSWSNIATSTIMMEDLMSDPDTGVFDIDLNSNHRRNNVISYDNGNKQCTSTSTHTTYPASMSSTQVVFATGRYYNGRFKTGETYLYILIK